jgi:hypothetical protein
MPWPFNRSRYRPPFKLKAYNAETREWEDVETYDRPVKLSEIKEYIEELIEDGYTRFRLEDSKGNKVWVKYYKSRERSEEEIADRFLSMMEKWATVMEKMSQIATPKFDPNELLASQVSVFLTIRNFCERFPDICGVSKTSIEDTLVQVLLGRLVPQQVATPSTAPTTPVPAPGRVVPPRPTEEGIRAVNEIVEKAMKEATEIWETECRVLGVCREEVG